MTSTALLIAIYLDGAGPDGFPRITRALKALKFYHGIKDRLGINQIYLTDNGSRAYLMAQVLHAYPDVKLIRHPHIDRGQPGPVHDYLPCWRAKYDVQIPILDGFDKIITIDDDAYILSDRLITHIKSLETGWTSFQCPKYGFPESALEILCRSDFSLFRGFVETPYKDRNMSEQPMEKIIPYTFVDTSFNLDRYGEDRLPQIPSMDAYFQCQVDIPMIAEASCQKSEP